MRILSSALLLGLALTISGCGYLNYYMGKSHWNTTFQNFPSMSALNRIAPEDSLIVEGAIANPQKRHEPLLLVAISDRYRKNEKVFLVQIQAPATEYMAFLPKGDYELMVFADLDRNRDFEWNELIGRTKVTVYAEKSNNRAVMAGPSITLDFEHPGKVDFRLSETVRPTSYVHQSLDSEFFDPKYGTTGLYNPSELIAHNQGFFFGLEEFDKNKVMVLFVHGISGTPRDWKYFAESLDRARFQPFFFYYPSGLPLDKLGSVLAQYIASVGRSSKDSNGFRIVLVAHSMGGLVALSAINTLASEGLPPSLALYSSFSTPYAGDEAARKALEIAPVMVPAWRDIAAGSDFLQSLLNKPYPRQLPFHLYFSYLDTSKFKLGESSDGSVSLRSQLLPSLQTAAARVIGFNDTHEGILNSKAARESFLKLLDTVSPKL